jgi:hypothetical protein
LDSLQGLLKRLVELFSGAKEMGQPHLKDFQTERRKELYEEFGRESHIIVKIVWDAADNLY